VILPWVKVVLTIRFLSMQEITVNPAYYITLPLVTIVTIQTKLVKNISASFLFLQSPAGLAVFFTNADMGFQNHTLFSRLAGERREMDRKNMMDEKEIRG
jgi:hypothetical protein